MLLYVLLVILTGWALWKMLRGDGIDLPGPRPWPLVGNIFQIAAENLHHRTFHEWHKQYNGVYKMYRLGTPMIVVGTYEAIHEVLVKRGKDFAGRPQSTRIKLLSDSLPRVAGLGFSDPTPAWKMFRQTVQKNLKQFDSGMLRIQEVAQEICRDLMASFDLKNGEPFYPRADIVNAVLSNLALFLVGKKLSPDHELIKRFLDTERQSIQVISPTGRHAMLDLFPWLAYVTRDTVNQCEQMRRNQIAFMDGLVKEAATVGEDEPLQPLVSAFVALAPHIEDADTHVRMASVEMMFAGSSTSTAAFTTFINILTHFRDVYKNLQAEVDNVLGERTATLDNRDSMPYMRATLFELLRYASILPLAIPHRSLVESKIGDVKVPKGTEVLVNLYSFLHDENYWPGPFEFRPERFLDDSGNLVPADHINRKRLMPFGAGPRVCVGEVFAMSRLFMMMCSLIQTFEVEQAEPKVTCDPRYFELTFVLFEPQFKVRLTRRNRIPS